MPVEEVRKLINAIDDKKTEFNSPPFISKKLRELVGVPEPIKHQQRIENKLEQTKNELQKQTESKLEQTKDELMQANNELKQQMNNIQKLLNSFIENKNDK